MSAQEDAVIEAVARAICRAHCGPVMRAKEPERVECQVENGWDMWADEASAAISIVIEECAKVVEAQYQTGDHELGHFLNAAAAKIRSFLAYQRATRSREGTWGRYRLPRSVQMPARQRRPADGLHTPGLFLRRRIHQTRIHQPESNSRGAGRSDRDVREDCRRRGPVAKRQRLLLRGGLSYRNVHPGIEVCTPRREVDGGIQAGEFRQRSGRYNPTDKPLNT